MSTAEARPARSPRIANAHSKHIGDAIDLVIVSNLHGRNLDVRGCGNQEVAWIARESCGNRDRVVAFMMEMFRYVREVGPET